jgi:muconolactone delta-isomerase
MLFSVRLVSRQPHDVAPEAWQGVVSDQLRFVKTLYQQGKIKAIYRETGLGVLAIFDVTDAREMDTLLAQLPMGRYFESTTVNALWDMAPSLEAV